MGMVFFLGHTVYERWPLVLRLSGDEYTVELAKYPEPGSHLFRRQVLIDDQICSLVLNWFWPSDVCMERYRQHEIISRATALAMIIYPINCRKSFSDARTVLEDIATKSREPSVRKILVGYSQGDIEDNRDVSREEGEALAREYSCPFFEVSLMDDDHIEELLTMMGRLVRDRLLT